MGLFSDSDEKKAAKRQHTSERFGWAHGYETNDIDQIIRNNPRSYADELDKKAMANVSHPDRHRPEVRDNLSQKNMRNIKGITPSIGGIPLGGVVSDRVPFIGGTYQGLTSDVDRFTKMVSLDQDKKTGARLHGRGAESGYGHTIAQAKMASRSTRAMDFVRHLNPLGGSSMESYKMAMGFTGRDSRILAAKGNFMENINRRAIGPAVGLFMATGALESDDPLTEYAAGVLAGAGVQQGWRAGKSFANVLGPTHTRRIGFGLLGGATMAAVGAGVVLGQADMFKNDSFIAKQAKSAYSRESFSSLKDTQASLTMRQAGLEKLSSSYLNNRQQLLGNEASVLRNSQS